MKNKVNNKKIKYIETIMSAIIMKNLLKQHCRRKNKSLIKALCFCLMIAVVFICTSEAMAADIIDKALSKIVGVTSGIVGKLIIFVSIAIGLIMAVLGFPWRIKKKTKQLIINS